MISVSSCKILFLRVRRQERLIRRVLLLILWRVISSLYDNSPRFAVGLIQAGVSLSVFGRDDRSISVRHEKNEITARRHSDYPCLDRSATRWPRIRLGGQRSRNMLRRRSFVLRCRRRFCAPRFARAS